MLLHEEYHRPESRQHKQYMARHYYDLYCMTRAGVSEEAADDRELFLQIAKHRRLFFPRSYVRYDHLIPGNLRLVPKQEHMAAWKADYENMQQEMFYGNVPGFDEMMDSIRQFETQFNSGHTKGK